MKKRRTSYLLFLIFLSGCSRDIPAQIQKAKEAYQKKKYVETIDLITEVRPLVDKSPNSYQKGEAYQILGLAYDKLKKNDKAMEAYAQAVFASTHTYQSAINLGFMCLASSNPKMAVKIFTRALQMKHDDPTALLGLGNAHYQMKDYKSARLHYQRILDSSPAVNEALEYVRLSDQKIKRPSKPQKSRRRR